MRGPLFELVAVEEGERANQEGLANTFRSDWVGDVDRRLDLLAPWLRVDPEQNMLEKAIDGKKQPISAAHGREYGKHVGTAEEIKEARRVAYQQKRRDREAKKVRSQGLNR